MTDSQIESELIILIKRAVRTFKFPEVALDYNIETTTSGESKNKVTTTRYYFVNDITEKEIAIILAWTKAYWSEYMISNADNYNNLYFDSNINAFSPGNLLHNYKES
jgi:hypothetical protein